MSRTPQITVELQIEYIRVLLDRLRMPSADTDAGSLCDRIEANLDALVELLVDAPSRSVSEPASNYSDAIPAPQPEVADDVATESPPASRPAADIPSDGMGPEETDRQPTEAPAATNLPSHQRPSSGVDGASPLTRDAYPEGPAPKITARQQEYLEAARRHDGNLAAAARDLGVKNSGGIVVAFGALRTRGLMPSDVDAMIERRKATPVRDGHAEMVLRAEVDAQRIAHGIAERARAAARDVVAARDADDSKHRDRAKAKADQVWRERHPEQM